MEMSAKGNANWILSCLVIPDLCDAYYCHAMHIDNSDNTVATIAARV